MAKPTKLRFFLLMAGILMVPCLGGGCVYLEASARQQAVRAQQLVQDARDAMQSRDTEKATRLLTEAIALNPRDADAHLELARTLADAGRSADSIEQLQFAAQLTTDDPLIWIELATQYREQQSTDLAHQAISKALSFEPRNVEALWIAARIQQDRDQPREAIQYCHRILAINPQHVGALNLTARIHVALHEPERAAPLLRQIGEMQNLPQNQQAETQWLLGVSYGQQLRWDDACQFLEQSLQLQPQRSADDFYRIAYANWQGRNPKATGDYLRIALQVQPTHSAAQQMLASVFPADSQGNNQVAGIQAENSGFPIPAGWSASRNYSSEGSGSFSSNR